MPSVHYNLPLRRARMTEVIDAIDAHATNEGTLEIGTTGMAAVLVIVDLDDPSFTLHATDAQMIMAGAPKSGTADVGGTTYPGVAAEARIKDGGGTVVVGGLTVTTTAGTGEIKLNSVNISQDQTVTISSGTISHAAGIP